MKLHRGPISPFARKVMICAHEKGLASRVEKIQSLVAMNAANDAVMRDNPLSKIPTLIRDDGVALFDSDVICEYLDTLHTGTPLIPVSGEPRWQALRWNAMGSGMMDALILWRNERMRPEAHQSVPTLQTYAKKIAASLNWVEHDMPSLQATELALGHIAIGCMFGYMDIRFTDIDWRAKHPLSARWFAGFLARPSVQATDSGLVAAVSPVTGASRP